MRNVTKTLGIIIIMLIIMVSITACSEIGDGTNTGGNSTPTLRYQTVRYNGGSSNNAGNNYNLVYSARDNTNNYYLFLLGHVNYVPLASRPAYNYYGERPITISYSSSNVTIESISRSVEEARSHSVTNNASLGWSVTTEVGIEAGVEGGWFAAKASASISTTVNGSVGWDETNTRSVANTYTTASSWSSEETDTVYETIGNHNEPPGKYRYSLFSTSDVYYVLVTNRARTQVTRAYTVVSARPRSLSWGIDYEPDMGGSFAKTAPGDLLEIPTVVLSQLPEPTDVHTGDEPLPPPPPSPGQAYEMAFVPGGSFQMGTPLSGGGDSTERPVRTVTVSEFYMGKYEVTQELYQSVTGHNPSYFSGTNLPVERVTWYDAVEFANKLSEREGLQPVYTISNRTPSIGYPIEFATVTANSNKNGYRLPTEAEWEYAAKGGNGSPGNLTYSGSNNPDNVAWYFNNSGSTTNVVGAKAPNGLGIYDLSGNVWEWCWDWYGSYSSGAQTNPMGPSSGAERVGRGGGWEHRPEVLRSARRSDDPPSYRNYGLGLRLVRR